MIRAARDTLLERKHFSSSWLTIMAWVWLLMMVAEPIQGSFSASGTGTGTSSSNSRGSSFSDEPTITSTTTTTATTSSTSTGGGRLTSPPTETIPRDTTPAPPTTPAPTTALDKYSIFGLPGWATPVIIVSGAMILILLIFSVVRCVDNKKKSTSRERNQAQVDDLRATLIEGGAPVRIETRLAQSLRRGGAASRSPKPSASGVGSNQGTPRGGMRGRMDSTGSYETIPSGNTSPRRVVTGGGAEDGGGVGSSSILFSGTFNSQSKLNSTIGSQGGGRVGRMASLLGGQAATVGSGSMNSPRRTAMSGPDEEVEHLMLSPRGGGGGGESSGGGGVGHGNQSPAPGGGVPSQSILMSGTSLENQHQHYQNTRRGSLQATTKPPPQTTFMKVPDHKDIDHREERLASSTSRPAALSIVGSPLPPKNSEEEEERRRKKERAKAAELEKLHAWEQERQRVMHAKDDSILAWLSQTSEAAPAARGPTSSAIDIENDPLLFDDPSPSLHQRSDSGDPFSSIQ